MPSSLGLTSIVLGLLGVVALAGGGILLWMHREKRQLAEEVNEMTGPDVALVTEMPEPDALAAGEVESDVEWVPARQDAVTDGGVVTDDVRSVADSVRLTPSMPTDSSMSLIGTWRHRAKAKKLARKGYVKWYKVGPNMTQPQWIKPFRNGQGELVYYDDDSPYLFPEEAMTTDARTGAHVCIHKEGDSLPIDLNDPDRGGLDTDKFQETIDLSVESDAPGFFDRLEIDGPTLLYGGMALMLALAGAAQFFGGGF